MDEAARDIPDFSIVSDPMARLLLEQMQGLIISLQNTIEQQNITVQKLSLEIAELRRLLFGKKSERMPPMNRELKRKSKEKGIDPNKARQEAQKKRRGNAKAKKELPTEEVKHTVPEEDQVCPYCGGTRFRDLGDGEISYEYEYIPGRFVRRKHIREKKTCQCNACILTAPAPLRVSDGVQYGPGFHAHVVVSKCCDSLPLYRQAKQLKRTGVPIGRSTLGDIFHRSADLLKVLHDRMLNMVPEQPYVNADETPIPVLAPEKTRRSYIWTFIADQKVVYVYSPTRSGQTPDKVLGKSTGFIQVDGYSGYNQVCKPERRVRIGCLAHVRRYFWKARETSPKEADWVLNKILELYQVEYKAAEEKILGTEKHLLLRKQCSAPLMDEIELYLEEQEPDHLPESPFGKAITYTTNSWKELNVFLTDPKISLDNNISERQLRIIAIGRKNFMFLGNDDAGDHLAILQSLVSTCELNGINPLDYLTDVLIRIQTHPASQIDELLPHNWKPPGTS